MLQSETVKKYDKYKDSGIEWIGEIPQEWKFAKLAWCSNFVNGYAFNSENMDIEGEVPVVRIGDIQNNRVQYETCLKVDSSEELKPYELKVNDVVIAMSGATTGKLAVICDDKQAYINQRVGIIRSKYNKFIRYCLDNESFMQYVALLSAGSAQPNISMGNILDYKIPYISVEEQQQIAEYLDKKCGEIDRVVETEKAVIEKLKEYKQSIITEAVTKGLDKSVPLKDSGIEWIGKIPQHWEVGKIKHKFYLSSEENNDENATLLSLFTHIGVRPRSEMEDKGNKAQTVIGYSLVRKGDIIVNKLLAWMGAIGLSDYDGATSPDYDIYRLRDLKNDCPMFYHYLFRSCNFKDECYKYGRGIMLMRLRTYPEEFLNIYIPTVSKEEQKQIVDYLDKKCSEIDKAIADKEQVIEKFSEYKKSLIYECVTGKRKVVE